MKKILTLVVVAMFAFVATPAAASNYFLDNAAVDAMFAQAEVIEINELQPMAPFAEGGFEGQTFVQADKDPLVAFLLAWFLGPLGIHRVYLGTSTGTVIGYILTAGGCGIVALVDWIMLLVGVMNDDISDYIDNPRFFMW